MSLFKKTERASTPNFESRRHYIFEVPFNELEFGIENADELLTELDAGNSCRKCVKYLELLIEHAKSEMGMA